MMINLTIGRRIKISGMPEPLKKVLRKNLTLVNPTYYIMERMGRWLGDTKSHYKYFKDKGDDLLVPRGILKGLGEFITQNKLVYGRKFATVRQDAKILHFSGVLRDYQQDLVDKLEKTLKTQKEGIISMTTGAGKTIVGLEVIRRLGLTATIIVPKVDIFNQFKETCEKQFGYEPGQIGAGKKIIKDITIATYQSLAKNKDLLKKLANQTSILLVDECQDVPAHGRARIIESFKADYVIGLSATPKRTDGRGKAVFFYMGQIFAKYKGQLMKPSVEVIYTGIVTPTHKIKKLKTKDGKIKEIKQRLEYHEVIDSIIESKSRNRLLAGLVIGEVSQGRKVLVLTKRVKHYENVRPMVDFLENVHFISSKDPHRNALLSVLKEFGEFKAVFGTTALLSVGTDIPALDTLIIACDIKSSVLATQSVGRVLRLFKGKKDAHIIDLCDNKNFTLYRQYKEREKLYIRKGWCVKTPFETFNNNK